MFRMSLCVLSAVAMLALAATESRAIEIRIGTFVPEKSVGVSRVIKPWGLM